MSRKAKIQNSCLSEKLMRNCPPLARSSPLIFLALPQAGDLLCFEQGQEQLQGELEEMKVFLQVAPCSQHLLSDPGRAARDEDPEWFLLSILEQNCSAWQY